MSLNVDHINDPDRLHDVIRLLDQQNETLVNKVRELSRENRELKGEGLSAQEELALLEQLLAQGQRKSTQGSSEKAAARSENPKSDTTKPRTGHGPRSQPELDCKVVRHELDTDDRECMECGGTLEEMGTQCEESEEITVIRQEFVLLHHQRQKYRCRCNMNVVTAPGPLKLRERSRYSIDFAVEVALEKYLYHAPLERQVRKMRDHGLRVDSQTLWDQLNALARVLEPCYLALPERVRASPIVHADETSWKMMGAPRSSSRKSKKWWVWVMGSLDAVYYRIDPERTTEAACRLLEGYQGLILTDGYAAYKSLEKSGGQLQLAHCWAHVRRKFVEIEGTFTQASKEILELIGELYGVERQVPLRVDMSDEEQAQVLARRAIMRAEESRPIIQKIQRWAFEQHALPRSALGQAIAYMLNLWPGLTRFLDDPNVVLDNNAAERAMRAVVVGRKNHYGSRSRRGTEVAALFYSLIETAKLSTHNPRDYLREATYAALNRAAAGSGLARERHGAIVRARRFRIDSAGASSTLGGSVGGGRLSVANSHRLACAELSSARLLSRDLNPTMETSPASVVARRRSAHAPLCC